MAILRIFPVVGYTSTMAPTSVTSSKQHITTTPGVCGGKPCIAGSRVRVWDVACLAQAGQSPDEILAHYPHLTLADVHAALAYYYDNREEIEAQMAADDRFADDLRQKLGQQSVTGVPPGQGPSIR